MINSVFKKCGCVVSILLLIVSLGNGAVQAGEIPAAKAELVWVEQVDKLYQLRFSTLVDSEWSEPILLYQSENFLTSPAIGTDQNGAKLLIWTEQKTLKSVLKSMQRQLGEEWLPAIVFADQGSENYAASIVYDLDNTAWVFWASTHNELSDIYLTKSTGLEWTPAELIHGKNEVPDILPVASLNRNGEVVVSWTKYSFASQGYITADKVFSEQRSNQAMRQSLADAVLPEQVSLPGFVPDKRLVALHFPTNTMVQSRPVSLE